MITSPSSLRRSERSRRAILEAALELCTEKGYGRVTIEAIAARAGVSKKTIYRWWPAKSAVILEAFTDDLVGTTPFADTGDIAADLRANLMGAVRLLSTPPYGPAYAGILSEVHHDDALAETVRRKLVDPRFEEAVARLRRAQEQGQIPVGADLPLAVEMLYGPVYYRHVLRKPVPDERTIAALVAQVLRALGTREAREVPMAPVMPRVPEARGAGGQGVTNGRADRVIR
ncbi:TetR/AcrR family transcriptional regulator [Streptomyces sp. NPDC052042]|uniref:TetR/AcrR family transcriptional regulator n=1 Tax=Streptomyces sp. NPDC052042 TaxID=3365683 RepID=UPI0037D1E8B5